jgi:hypothetical protein
MQLSSPSVSRQEPDEVRDNGLPGNVDTEPELEPLDASNGDEVPEDEYSEPLHLQGERRLITQPYDYSIQQLVDEIARGKIRLDIEYQRQYVWDDGKASRLVESLLLNVPIPVCLLRRG